MLPVLLLQTFIFQSQASWLMLLRPGAELLDIKRNVTGERALLVATSKKVSQNRYFARYINIK